MKNILQKVNLVAIILAVLAFTLGWQLGHRDLQTKWVGFKPVLSVENKNPPEKISVNFKLFWDSWDLLSRNYLDKKALDPNKMVYGAIQGMVASLGDPYTVFLPPQQQQSTKEELGGSFEGVGMELGYNSEKRLVVVAPLDDTPAAKAGIKPQDMILKINDKDTTGISLQDAVSSIRGPKGSSVLLNIYRDGEKQTRDLSINRDTIVIKSVVLSFKNTPNRKKVAIIRLSRFGEKTYDEWNEAVSQVLSEGVSGVALDLRNNPGGFLDGAVYVASEFLRDGDVVLQENARGERNSLKVSRVGKLLDLPLVVLVNKGSASASEIVSGALQDKKRAKLIGEQTFGKGTIQESEDLPGGTGIHITVAKWLTPNGRWANATTGFMPDVVVELPKIATPEAKLSDTVKDIQLDRALEVLDQSI